MALSQADVLAGLKEIVEEVAGIPAASIELDKNFTVEERRLWTESGENFAERLQSALEADE